MKTCKITNGLCASIQCQYVCIKDLNLQPANQTTVINNDFILNILVTINREILTLANCENLVTIKYIDTPN